MKLEVQEQLKIPDGLHKGAIVDVEYREKPYEYTDIVIEFMLKDKPIRLKAGYPTFISESSKLGQLLARFNMLGEVGSQVDPSDMIGKECQFQTITEGKYSNVMPVTVKPIE